MTNTATGDSRGLAYLDRPGLALHDLLANLVAAAREFHSSGAALVFATRPKLCSPAQVSPAALGQLARHELKTAVAAVVSAPACGLTRFDGEAFLPPEAGVIDALDTWIEFRDDLTRFGWAGLDLHDSPYPRDEAPAFLQSLSASASAALSRALLSFCARQRDGEPLEMAGRAEVFLQMERRVKRAALLSSEPVLITGERGTGKELVARAIHHYGARSSGPFVPAITSMLPESLQADDLFGHLRHAFTGAQQSRGGKVRAAEKGTLFIDEVGDLSPSLQLSLLRLVERGEIHVIGQDTPFRGDVRIVTATNKDLRKLIQAGSFREDLFDRLSVIPIRAPSLRERREDIPLLARYFLANACRIRNRRSDGLDSGRESCRRCQGESGRLECASPGFYDALLAYAWPGNVRELKNLILRLCTFHAGEELWGWHVRRYLSGDGLPDHERPSPDPDVTLRGAIRTHIVNILQQTEYNQSQAARRLGIPLSTFRHHLRKLEIGVPLRPFARPGTDANDSPE